MILRNTPSGNELPHEYWVTSPSDTKWLYSSSSSRSCGVIKHSGFKWVMLLCLRSSAWSFLKAMPSIEAIDLITLCFNLRYSRLFAMWCKPSEIVSKALKGIDTRLSVRQSLKYCWFFVCSRSTDIINNDVSEWAISCKGGNCCNWGESMAIDFSAKTPLKAVGWINCSGLALRWSRWKDNNVNYWRKYILFASMGLHWLAELCHIQPSNVNHNGILVFLCILWLNGCLQSEAYICVLRILLLFVLIDVVFTYLNIRGT